MQSNKRRERKMKRGQKRENKRQKKRERAPLATRYNANTL